MSGEYQLSIDQVLTRLGSDTHGGLSTAAASERLARFGPNELPAERPIPAWRRFLAQFKGVLVLLLLVAKAIHAILCAVAGATALPYEAIAIASVVLLNAVVGYLQESRAESAVAALRQMAAAHARVIRNGEPRTIPAAELVPGDILLVEEGD